MRKNHHRHIYDIGVSQTRLPPRKMFFITQILDENAIFQDDLKSFFAGSDGEMSNIPLKGMGV